jgi:hypothetical protein
MAKINIIELDTPIEGSHDISTNEHEQSQGKKSLYTPSSCCENPRSYGYPTEDPVVYICFICGSWNWKNY